MHKFLLFFMVSFYVCAYAGGFGFAEEGNSKQMFCLPISVAGGSQVFIEGEYTGGGFIKTAVIFAGTKRKNIFFEVNGAVVKDKKNRRTIDGRQYGTDFYGWKIEIVDNGFCLHPFWNKGKSTTDPIIFYFNAAAQMFEKFSIPKSDL